MMVVMASTSYRLQMSVLARLRRVTLYVALGVLFVPILVDARQSLLVRLGCVLGLGLVGFGLRVVVGPAVVVRPDCLRIYTWWPRHRDLAWYRIYAVEAPPDQGRHTDVKGGYGLEIELNSGERIMVPPVEQLDALVLQIDDLRQQLDAPDQVRGLGPDGRS